MKKITAEQIVENLSKFYSYIDKYITGDRKDKLITYYKSMEDILYVAPASSKLDYHNCFPGGYVDHVNRVIEASLILEKVWDKFNQEKNYNTEELVFSAINHDLGKLGSDGIPFYIQNDSQWHIEKQGAYYKYNPELTHMRVSDRSLYNLQKAGIPVTENEYIAIKTHDGLYEDANKVYLVTYTPESKIKTNLPHILHQADFMASKIEPQIK